MSRVKTSSIVPILLFSLILVCTVQVADTRDKSSLRIGYLPLLSQLPLIVSYENDRLNFATIQLELHRYNSFTSLEAALRVGAIDVASIPVPIAFSILADGHPIKILGTCHSGGSRLVARAKGDMETVRGKLIGVPGLDSGESLRLNEVMGEINLKLGLDYKTIGVPFSTVIDDLKAAKLDAIYLPEPFGSIAEAEKIAHEVEGQEGRLTGGINTVIVIRSEILKKNAAGIEEWLRSLVAGSRFIEKDIQTAEGRQTAIIQRPYFNYAEETVGIALIQRKGGLKFDHFDPEVEKIKKYIDLALKMRLILKSVDIDTLLSLELMQKVS